MFRLVRTLLSIAGVVVITMFALANRGPVDIDLLVLPGPVTVPLYSLFLAGLLGGALLGGIAAWLSGWRSRREARAAQRRLSMIEAREQARLDAEAAARAARTEPAAKRTLAPAGSAG